MSTSSTTRSLLSGSFLLPMAPALLVAGCSAGPAPLTALVSTDDEVVYQDQVAAHDGDTRAAYLAWRSDETGTPAAVLAAEDELLPVDANPFDADDLWAASRGALLFQAHCVECHGRAADGLGEFGEPLPGRKDFHNPHIRAGLAMSDGYVAGWFRKVHDGVVSDDAADVMPAFGDQLTNEQIWLTITYLATKESLVAEAGR